MNIGDRIKIRKSSQVYECWWGRTGKIIGQECDDVYLIQLDQPASGAYALGGKCPQNCGLKLNAFSLIKIHDNVLDIKPQEAYCGNDYWEGEWSHFDVVQLGENHFGWEVNGIVKMIGFATLGEATLTLGERLQPPLSKKIEE